MNIEACASYVDQLLASRHQQQQHLYIAATANISYYFYRTYIIPGCSQVSLPPFYLTTVEILMNVILLAQLAANEPPNKSFSLYNFQKL